jgi:putative membrane protein
MKINVILRGAALNLAFAGLCGLPASSQTTNQTPTDQDQMGMKSGSMKSGSMSSKISAADESFMKKAAQGSMAEVELGQLAQQRATNPDVKKFSQRMIDDHTKANNDLKQVASADNVTLPDSLDAKDQATKQKLLSISGDQFDKAYMSDMVTDHTKDVAEFRKESTSAQDPAVKNFATTTLPTLEDHLKEARQIAPQVMK